MIGLAGDSIKVGGLGGEIMGGLVGEKIGGLVGEIMGGLARDPPTIGDL